MIALPQFQTPPCMALAMALVLLGAGCTTPGGGLATPNLVDDEKVRESSLAQWNQIKSSSRISRNPAHLNRVDRIIKDLTAHVSWWEVMDSWEVVVFENKANINAFAMAGGKIGVYTGLLDVVENDDQLAFVLAHEMAHVTEKHVHKKLSEQMLLEAGGMVVGTAASVAGGSLIGYGVSSMYNASSGVAGLTFDRDKEREADIEGLFLMARAGYNPEEAIRIVELVNEKASAGRRAPSAWLSTHPSAVDRMGKLVSALPEARKIYDQSSSGYGAPVGGVIDI